MQTTMGCPAFDGMRDEIVERVKGIGAEEVFVQLTFDPPWSKERMSEEAKVMFRYLF